jgi:hypothetical protein
LCVPKQSIEAPLIVCQPPDLAAPYLFVFFIALKNLPVYRLYCFSQTVEVIDLILAQTAVPRFKQPI